MKVTARHFPEARWGYCRVGHFRDSLVGNNPPESKKDLIYSCESLLCCCLWGYSEILWGGIRVMGEERRRISFFIEQARTEGGEQAGGAMISLGLCCDK